jgi:hypothetical protein
MILIILSLRPPSSRGGHSPPLLTLLDEFVHVSYWPNLEDVAVRQRRMLRHELYSMIHIPRLKDENAAELFLGFRIGTVSSCHFAVLPMQGQGRFLRLKRFSTSPVPVGAKMVVVFKAFVEDGVSLALSHAIKFGLIVVSQTDVFHPFLLVSCDPESRNSSFCYQIVCFLREIFGQA